MDRAERDQYLENLGKRVASGEDGILDSLCHDLKDRIPSYNWVGIYVLKKQKLVLENFAGEKTEHEQIALGDGLCSMAIVTNAIVNEPDVKGNSKYLACFPSTKSEIVVPIKHNGRAIGEIDIDSDTKNAFGSSDEEFLASLAEIIAEKVNSYFVE